MLDSTTWDLPSSTHPRMMSSASSGHPPSSATRRDYYHTLYHEMIHASGRISRRLNREGITQRTRFGSERYSKEELIGELGAAFLSNQAGTLDAVRFRELGGIPSLHGLGKL